MKLKLFKSLSAKIAAVALSAAMVLTPISVNAAAFVDTASHWASAQIDTMVAKGYFVGYGDGTFKPDNNITKAEFSSVLNQTFGYSAVSGVALVDVPATAWYSSIIRKVIAAGIITPDISSQAFPNKALTRGELFVMIAKAIGLTPVAGETTFLDNASIPTAVKPYIKALQLKGYVVGYAVTGGYNVLANNLITRAETIQVMNAMNWPPTPSTPTAPPVVEGTGSLSDGPKPPTIVTPSKPTETLAPAFIGANAGETGTPVALPGAPAGKTYTATVTTNVYFQYLGTLIFVEVKDETGAPVDGLTLKLSFPGSTPDDTAANVDPGVYRAFATDTNVTPSQVTVAIQ